jgi:uncharacterized protein YpbB
VTYLITLLSNTQARRIRVIENILTNHRTVATLFWGMRYQILPYLDFDHGLQRPLYEQQLRQMQSNGLVTIENQQILLTSNGQAVKEKYIASHYQPQFVDKWLQFQTDNIQILMLLAVQVVSEYSYQNTHYAPLVDNEQAKRTIKRWFHAQQKSVMVEQFSQEIAQFLETLSENEANFLAYQLVGHQSSGLAENQITTLVGQSNDDIQIMQKDLWSGFAAFEIDLQGIISQLLKPYQANLPVSQSAQQSFELFDRGRTLSQIAHQRRLKLSTVREHLLEVAIFTKNQFPYHKLLSQQQIVQYNQLYKGNIDTWQFHPIDGEDASEQFFLYRMFQIMRSYQDHG